MNAHTCLFALLLSVFICPPVGAQTHYSLEQLVSAAIQNNGDLRAVRQREQEAAGLLRQAGLQPNPSLGFEASNGAVVGSSGDYDFSVTYARTFERGNKRELRVAASEPEVSVAKFEEADRERVLRGEIAAAYVDAIAARRALETLSQLSRLNEQYLRAAQARVDKGEAAPLERGLLQVEFSRIDTDRLRLESDANRAIVTLKNLAGLKLNDEILLDGELNSMSGDYTLPDLIVRALAARPDLQAARSAEQARTADVRVARAEAVPDVVGFARYSFGATRFDQLGLNASGQTVPLSKHDSIITAGVSFDLKTRNRNQGQIDAASAREQAAKYKTAALAQQIEREVRAAAIRYDASKRTIAIFNDTLIAQSQSNLNTVRAAYEIGELKVFDLLSEQRRLIEIQRSYVDALKEVSLSRFDLETVVGGSLQ